MFGKFKSWHSGLSKAGKVVVWAAGTVAMVSVIGAANPSPPQDTHDTPPAQTEQADEPEITTETVTETAEIAFEKTTVNDASLEQGKTSIKTAGVNGVKTLTYQVTKTDGQQTDKKLVKEEVTTAPITQVTAIGTKVPYVAPKSNCDPNYSGGCVPIVSYDLDCADIGFSVRIVGHDPHGFDGYDNDGFGCESY